MIADRVPLDPARVLPLAELTHPSFKADPFPLYARLREESPVHPAMLPRKEQGWLVTRYSDVADVLKDDRLLKNRADVLAPGRRRHARAMPRHLEPLTRNLLSLDGADHRRLRLLVQKAFTLRRIQRMREEIQDLADRLLDDAQRRGQFDLIADYALPLPLTIIGRILGVPERDNSRFGAWTKAFAAAPTRNPLLTAPGLLRFMHYLRRLVAERSLEPRDDLISALVEARQDDDRLSADEVLAMIFLLLSAGHETTVNLIGSGTLALLEHPDQVARLRADPGLTASAVEELLRYVVPAEMATQRYASEDLTIADVAIPRGAPVVGVIASANRDPAHFDDPDTLDLGRTDNRHLSFGHGIHYCLGAPLSRLEGQIAVDTLVRRMPTLRLSVPRERLRWRGGFVLRGLEELPVTV